jgi:hypothetical protein
MNPDTCRCRFIGPWCRFLSLHYIVNEHNRPLLRIGGYGESATGRRASAGTYPSCQRRLRVYCFAVSRDARKCLALRAQARRKEKGCPYISWRQFKLDRVLQVGFNPPHQSCYQRDPCWQIIQLNILTGIVCQPSACAQAVKRRHPHRRSRISIGRPATAHLLNL